MNTENLKAARKASNKTQKEVADALGVGQSTYKNYECGIREPNGDTIVALANLFGVSTDYLLGREPLNNPLEQLPIEDDEKSVLEGYLSLPPAVRAQILDVMIQLAQRAQATRKSKPKLFVLRHYSQHKVSAGVGFDLNDPDIWQDLTVIDCPEAHEADFAVQVEGDSMEDTLHDEDIVYVKMTPDVPIGDIGIFIVDGAGYIKERGTDRLISHNPDYDPIFLEGKEQRCIGRVIGVAEVADT